MNAKKWTAMLCAAALAVSLAACGTRTAETADAGSTLTGQVSAVDGSEVTLLLGTLEESEAGTAPGSTSGQNSQTGVPPEKPEGSSDSGSAPGSPNGQSSAKPDGDSNGGTPPDMPSRGAPDGQSSGSVPSGDSLSRPGGSFTAGTESITLNFADAVITENGRSADLDDIEAGVVLTVVVGAGNTAVSADIVSLAGGMGTPGGFGGSSEVTQGSSANTISEDGSYANVSCFSSGDDENALRVDGADVTLDQITVNKSAGATSNTENGDFYGVNAALLATNGATVNIRNAAVTSSARNGNGVFSYGSGTTVNISDSVITTTADNSGGIQTTGGGTTNAANLTVETSGNSSAAIRSDRGGGTVNVTGGTYTSNGYNSPAVYSTADITVKNAALTANNSEALVIEGKNSITLEDCTVSGNMSDTKGTSSDENVHNVMIYQSMSGDADMGTSTLSMTGGSLTAKNGDMFYVTNTHCVLTLSGVALKNEDGDGVLLRVVGNSASHGWGTAGANGAQVDFTADAQALDGDIVVDTISTLNMTLTNGSSFTGTVNIVDNAEGGDAVSDNAVITIGSGCVWTLTGDCTVTSLTNNGTINFNGYTITLADGTVLR